MGPHGLGLARAEGVLGFLGVLGMTFLFFLAGLEIDFERIRGRPLALAGAGWLLSLALAAGTVAFLEAIGFVRAPVMMTIALTTTAIGTLLPILRDAGELETPFGSFVLAGMMKDPIPNIGRMALADAHPELFTSDGRRAKDGR